MRCRFQAALQASIDRAEKLERELQDARNELKAARKSACEKAEENERLRKQMRCEPPAEDARICFAFPSLDDDHCSSATLFPPQDVRKHNAGAQGAPRSRRRRGAPRAEAHNQGDFRRSRRTAAPGGYDR